jgi:hypothetical protein
MNALMALIGGAIAVAGYDKLAGDRGYQRMFAHLGWSGDAMLMAAVAETAGGALMMPASTRRLGGAMVAGVSMAMLTSEIRSGEPKLGIARGLVLAAGLCAVFASTRRAPMHT